MRVLSNRFRFQTSTPPALDSPASRLSAFLSLANFARCSYAYSSLDDSCFLCIKASFNYFPTVSKFEIIDSSSWTTSAFVFSNMTPLTSLQHFLPSSSLLIDSRTSWFSFLSSSTSMIRETRAWTSYYRIWYRLPTSLWACSSVIWTCGACFWVDSTISNYKFKLWLLES